MKGNSTPLPKLDRLVHEPARLAILSALSDVEQADFNSLLLTLGLSRGNLSSHMTKLAEAGYVAIDKRFVGNLPNTTYAITDEGRSALDGYWAQLETLRGVAKKAPELLNQTATEITMKN